MRGERSVAASSRAILSMLVGPVGFTIATTYTRVLHRAKCRCLAPLETHLRQHCRESVLLGRSRPGEHAQAASPRANDEIRATLFSRVPTVMHFSRLAIAVVAVSMSVVAQAPQWSGYGYLCPSELKTYRNLFLRGASVHPASTTLLHCRVDWTRLTPPPEFRPHDLTALDTMGVNPHFTTHLGVCSSIRTSQRHHLGV
jgi:hypothetical protein